MVSINVAQLLLAPTGTVRSARFSQRLGTLDADLPLVGPVAGEARLLRTSRGILATGRFRAPVCLACARCLKDVHVKLDGRFEDEFFPTADVKTGLAISPGAEGASDPDLRIDDHHDIHLEEVLRQTLITLLPQRPLCEAACPGLCVVCGERLDASHRPHADGGGANDRDPVVQGPFAALADLLREEGGDDTDNAPPAARDA